MIKTQYCVPETLYRDSRDFQLLGRVFDVVFNSLKSNSELIATNPLSDNMDEGLLNLLAATVGLQTLHNYNNPQLRAVCSAFSSMLRTKGTRKSLELATNALLGAEGISKKARVEFDKQQGVKVFLPIEMRDITLLNDLLDYLIPAGVGCEVVREAAVEVQSYTEVGYGADQSKASGPVDT